MNKRVWKSVKDLRLGSLVRVDWFDASTGKTAIGGPIDIPVKSWGIHLGVFGEKNKHIVIAQNTFRMGDQGLFDIDYTAIPLTWMTSVSVTDPTAVDPNEADKLLQSFTNRARKHKLKTSTIEGEKPCVTSYEKH